MEGGFRGKSSAYERLLVEGESESASPSSASSSPSLRRGSVSTLFSGLAYVKSTVGVGVFALPFALRGAGLWVGLLGFALIALLAFYTVMLLVAIRVHRGCEDYAACGREAMGTCNFFFFFFFFFFFLQSWRVSGEFCGDCDAGWNAHCAGAVYSDGTDELRACSAALCVDFHLVAAAGAALLDSRCQPSALAQHVWCPLSLCRNHLCLCVRRFCSVFDVLTQTFFG
jgi:hypothetical protein